MQTRLRDLASSVARHLSSKGFRALGLENVRQKGLVISCLAVQQHSSEPRFCVNLGVHLSFLPAVGSRVPVALEEMTVTHCEVRRRLTPSEDVEDFWWSYEDAGALEDCLAAVDGQGIEFFERLEEFPDYWTRISLDALKTGAFTRLLPGMTDVRAALLLARVHKYLGDSKICHEFASFGLEIVPAIASGPKKALRELLSS